MDSQWDSQKLEINKINFVFTYFYIKDHISHIKNRMSEFAM